MLSVGLLPSIRFQFHHSFLLLQGQVVTVKWHWFPSWSCLDMPVNDNGTHHQGWCPKHNLYNPGWAEGMLVVIVGQPHWHVSGWWISARLCNPETPCTQDFGKGNLPTFSDTYKHWGHQAGMGPQVLEAHTQHQCGRQCGELRGTEWHGVRGLCLAF